ncbi:hypothetical protein Tco_0121833 [Tanacetum coccineum]
MAMPIMFMVFSHLTYSATTIKDAEEDLMPTYGLTIEEPGGFSCPPSSGLSKVQQAILYVYATGPRASPFQHKGTVRETDVICTKCEGKGHLRNMS